MDKSKSNLGNKVVHSPIFPVGSVAEERGDLESSGTL